MLSSSDPDMELYVRLAHGKEYVYHTGFLACDRTRAGEQGVKALAAAKSAYKAYQSGLVYLVQRKLGPYKFQYIAVRR